ncbi:sulfite exporter TauE/SafE family protein [Pseudomonas coronafaciens]|uniref:sulfite exporter TauE/SafE family protein n=1 Tax=Pseudomonas coronafaciens TaxID=53409 RepID=UPI000E3CAC82|nr:sulfite exporter TauE/SafE family protein [Pseudomonas coronafaciens]
MSAVFDFYHTLGWGLSALVIGTFLLAGTVKGVIGLGLPTVAMGLLGLVMLPPQAAALLIIPSAFTNVWQLATGGSLRPLLKRLWPMLIMIFIGTCVGAFWLGMSGSHSMTRALGGFITGVIASATGVFVIPVVPYLQALGLERDQLVQALGLSFTVSTAALAVGLSWNGALGGAELGASLIALAPALLGMMLGQWLRQRISAALFKRVFFIGMGLLGLHLLIKG